MKNLWVARLARPDLCRPTQKLATRVTKWTRNDDKRLRRLMEYMNTTQGATLKGYVCNNIEELELWLFVDADLASEADKTRSTNESMQDATTAPQWTTSGASTFFVIAQRIHH